MSTQALKNQLNDLKEQIVEKAAQGGARMAEEMRSQLARIQNY